MKRKLVLQHTTTNSRITRVYEDGDILLTMEGPVPVEELDPALDFLLIDGEPYTILHLTGKFS